MFDKPSVTVKLVCDGQTRHISANAGDHYPGMLVDGWRVVAIYYTFEGPAMDAEEIVSIIQQFRLKR